MHTLKCKSIEELVEVVVETYELLHDCDRNVSFVAKYDHAKEILRELVFYDYDLKFVELADPEWDNYEDEYVISIQRRVQKDDRRNPHQQEESHQDPEGQR